MTKKQIDQIKFRIRKKFGTIRCFCRLTGVDEKMIRHFLSGKMSPGSATITHKAITRLLVVYSKVKITNPDVIQPHERELVRVGIVTRFKSVSGFCEKYPQFNKVFISNVINGRRIRHDKRVDDLYMVIQKFK